MAITIDTDQFTLAKRATVAMFPLVVLETYSDRDARTVASSYYWTTGSPLRYQWDNVNTVTFDPVLRRVQAIRRGFQHLPDQGQYETREAISVTVDSTPQAGTYLWKTLLDENIVGARVTIGSLLVDPADFASPDWFDLSSWGRVHVVRWRGEVTEVPSIIDGGQAFTLTCETEELKLTATRVLTGWPYASPTDVGKPYPVPIGQANAQALFCHHWYEATLRRDAAAASTTLQVFIDENEWEGDIYDRTSSSIGDQAFSGRVIVGSELVSYESSVIATPGQGWVELQNVGARSVDYDEGAPVYFFPSVLRYALSGTFVADVGEVKLTTIDETEKRMDRAGNSAPEGLFKLVNRDIGPDGQPVAIIEVPDWIGAGTNRWASTYERATTRLDVEIMGTYTVAETADATPYAGIVHNVGTPWEVYPTGGTTGTSQQQYAPRMVGLNCTLSTPSATETVVTGVTGRQIMGIRMDPNEVDGSRDYPAVLEVTVNIPTATLATLRRLNLCVLSNDDLVRNDDPLAHRFFDAADLVAGDNTLRIHVQDDARTASTEMGVVAIHTVHDGDVNGLTWSVKDDIERYAITETSPAGAHPIDVVEQAIDDYTPTAAVSYDSTTFATAKTNTPDVGLSFDLAAYPTLGELLAAIGYNSRINFVLSETYTGTEVKAYTPSTAYAWGAAIRAIGSEHRDLEMKFRSLGEIANRFTALYDLGLSEDAGLYESYRKTLIANESTNELSSKVTTATITASQADFGVRDSIDLPFTMLRDEDAVIDVLGYYATEALRGQVERYTCVVPFAQGYDLEPGDIVSILPEWETTNQKVRVLYTVFSFEQNGVGLVLEAID